MRAVLLFSAVVHIAVFGLAAAYAVQTWMERRRPKEPTFPEFVGLAAVLAIATWAITALFMWPAHGFGHAGRSGLVAGVLVGATFLLALGAWPHQPANGQPMSQASRIAGLALVAAVLALELAAFCFLSAAAGRVAPYA